MREEFVNRKAMGDGLESTLNIHKVLKMNHLYNHKMKGLSDCLLRRNSAYSKKTGEQCVGLLQHRIDDCPTIDTSERAYNEVQLLLR